MNIPFSAYDSFGYLSNGFLILCATEYAFWGNIVCRTRLEGRPRHLLWVLAYIVGHIVANISSYMLEHKVDSEE